MSKQGRREGGGYSVFNIITREWNGVMASALMSHPYSR